MKEKTKKIGIIGAGAAGLASLRHCLEEGFECTAFEQTGTVGGTWNYSDRTDKDENGLPVHSSMYQGLKTNLPKELMEFQDFPYEEKGTSFIEQQDVVEYIRRFATHFNLYQHIKFFSHIIKVESLAGDKWLVEGKDLKTNEITKYTFDGLLVCVGSYFEPAIPNIPGKEIFAGNSIHSHWYRRPDGYKNKKVLLIGAGPSGIDISRLVGQVAKKVYLSYRNTVFHKSPDKVTLKPEVDRFTENSAIFKDGTEVKIDEIIYCTGYKYSYPFLTKDCGITVENNWVKYTYKHIVNVDHPTMGFIGLTFKVCPIPTFGLQVRFFLSLFKNHVTISKVEMMKDILEDMKGRKELGWPEHHAHKISGAKIGPYFDDLARTAKIQRLKPVLQKLYVYFTKNRDDSKRFKIINDNDFIEYS